MTHKKYVEAKKGRGECVSCPRKLDRYGAICSRCLVSAGIRSERYRRAHRMPRPPKETPRMTEAQRYLVVGCMPLVHKIANSYSRIIGYDVDDGIGLGTLALIQAAIDYDPDHDKGAAFSTYAYKAISNTIRRELHNLRSVIRIPSATMHCIKGLMVGREFTERRTKTLGKAAAQGIPIQYSALPISTQIRCEPAVKDGPNYAPEIHEAIKRLSGREQYIVERHYGIGCKPEPLRQIGTTLGISRQRTGLVELIALKKLREILDEGDGSDSPSSARYLSTAEETCQRR